MTTIHYNVPGSKRKELVKAIAAWTGTEFSYAGAPTFAYHADGMEIDRNGNLKLLGTTGGEAIERLMQHLHDEGFECDMNESTVEDTETAVAAYHAGRGRVNGWLADESISPDGKTLGDIPIPETAHYVRKVMRAVNIYEKLNPQT